MKFGKTIQSQQVPGWGEYYLNYKALKKIINSYAAGRSAADASILSLGLRPPKRPLASPGSRRDGSSPSQADATSPGSMLSPISDLAPLTPTAEPPTQTQGRSGILGAANDRGESFRAHRDVFFFTLQRELEKINAFYLIKERDLRLRLLSLLTSRKRLLQNGGRTDESRDSDVEDGPSNTSTSHKGAEWLNLEEGWRLFERDLGRLQGFIEINATGFRKILKKWDKRSKSNTKEMYIQRQVEVQPCFNREFMAQLSDIVTANLLDLENGSEQIASALFHDLPDVPDLEGAAFGRETEADAGQTLALDALAELEANLPKALGDGRPALVEWLKAARLRQQRDKSKRVMRVLWRSALQVPDDEVELILGALQLDFEYLDDINGRSPLHEACIAGSILLVKLCAERLPRLLELRDAYDRRAIHYAAMHGHPTIVSFLLERVDPMATDMDGYTPLMHAVVQGHLEVVRIFVNDRVTIEPTAISNDLIPLSLACQYGRVDVTRLLLQNGARVLPNSEGLYPQHFAAKAGHDSICRLLIEQGGEDGGGKDKPDKYNLWTPLHHAAVGGGPGHLACIQALVQAECDVNATDEYGKSPGWYAAWYGHVECLNFLLNAGAHLSGRQSTLENLENLGLAADPQMDSLSPGSDVELDAAADEFELIPSLSLPPPIIPLAIIAHFDAELTGRLRVYGHEFLAQRCLVQLSLGHPFSRSTGGRSAPIKLYSRSGQQDALQMWSSLKLVMTSTSDIASPPHSIILPLADEREVFAFQVHSLDKFTLELSLYPTFGSKILGRAVILPATFLDIRYHKAFVTPLLDHHLKAIGEVAFEVSCIKPFQGAQLEIGGRVETYWKSKVVPPSQTQDHAHQHQIHRPLTVSTSSPALRAPTGMTGSQPRESALVTASSLSGDYVQVIVQLTKDLLPVAYPSYTLPISGFEFAVPDINSTQFRQLSLSTDRSLRLPSASGSSPVEWQRAIASAMVTMDDLLVALPADVGINLQLLYLRQVDADSFGTGCSAEVNKYVDSVLHVVYEAGKATPGRKIIFSSFDPTVCTALNWKQPNYAVFFASYCGISQIPSDDRSSTRLRPAPTEEEPDLRCLSIREAVNFAKSTNLLGVMLEATTLAAVPSLVASVKDVGLLLATFGEKTDLTILRQGASDGRTVDAFVEDGVMTLTV